MVTILVLGRSGANGLGVERSETWPMVLLRELESELQTPVTIDVRVFHCDGRDPTAYLQRLFDEVQPDVVNIHPIVYDFAAARVENHVRDQFGNRAASIAYRVERMTTNPHASGSAGFVNRLARRLAHRFVGAAPRLAREQVEYTLDLAYRFFAQQEDVAVVVRSSAGASAVIAEANPAYAGLVDSFNAEWKARSLKHHFYWAEAEPYAETELMRDGVHMNAAGHERRARLLVPVFVRAIRERVLESAAR